MMHSWTTTSLALAMLFTAAGADAQANVILDTDFRADCDDAGALGVLHALADNGECHILGVAISDRDPWAPRGVDAVNTWYRRPNIPIGNYQGNLLAESSGYAGHLAHEFPNDYGPVNETAVSMYRRVLAQQPDASVKIVTTGFLVNIYDLLQSPPDSHSPLGGGALIQAKVNEVVILGGAFPNWGPEFNTHHNGLWTVSQFVATQLDTLGVPAIFCGVEIGQNVRTGGLIRQHPDIHPVGRAYEDWLAFFSLVTGQPQLDRPAWDQCVVLYAVRGLGTMWQLQDVGFNNITVNGNSWSPTPDSTHAYIQWINTAAGEAQLKATLDTLIQQWPAQQLAPYSIVATFEDGTSGPLKKRAINGVSNVNFGHLVLAGLQEHIITGRRPADQTIVAKLEFDNTQAYAEAGFTMRSPHRDGGWLAGPRVEVTHSGGSNNLYLRLMDGDQTSYGPVGSAQLIPGVTPNMPFVLRIDVRGAQVTASINGQVVLPVTPISNPAGQFGYTFLRANIPDAGVRFDYVIVRAAANGAGVAADKDGTIWFSEIEPGPFDAPVIPLSGVLFGTTYLDSVAWKNMLWSLGPNFAFEGLQLGSHELYGVRDIPWLFDTQLIQLHNGFISGVWAREPLQ